MQTFYRICLISFLCILCFFAGIGTYVFILSGNNLIIREYVENNGTPDKTEETQTVTNVPQTVDLNTKYSINEINMLTNEEKTTENEIPQVFVGSNREAIESFLSEYNKAPSLADKEKGFVNMQLKEFSPDKIVVEKFYKPLEKDIFYLKAEENCIVVYYSDLSTVYMYTDIMVDSLSEETKAELSEGKKIESLESLYSFLESSTS